MGERGDASFASVPDGQPAQDTHSINVTVDTERITNNSDEVALVELDAKLFINDESIGTLSTSGTSGNAFSFEFVNRFKDPGDYSLRVEVVLDNYGIAGYAKQPDGDETLEDSATITIVASREARRRVQQQEEFENYAQAYQDRASTLITNIETDSDVELAFDEIDFDPYDNPNISIDSSARFAVHDIIGGTTVRQKIGEDPTEVTLNGVCSEDVATQIDQLRRAKLVTLLSDRVPNGMTCQIASSSTDPLDDGGATDMDRGEFLYEYNINLVEIDGVYRE